MPCRRVTALLSIDSWLMILSSIIHSKETTNRSSSLTVSSGNLTVKHINRDQISVRVFGPTATLTARDTTNWIYHGRELSGQYKILNVYSKRDGEWKLCALQACPINP